MLSPAFAQVLRDGRADFNRRTLEARRRHTGFDLEAFTGFLAREVDPVVTAVAALAPERARDVAGAAYDVALELTGLRLVGPRARSQALAQAWREVLPRCAYLLAQDDAALLAAVCNAVVHLESAAGARPLQWVAEMAALAPRIRAVSEQYGLPLDPERRVHSMSVGERQRVEIVRCLLQSPRLLIMDEPTSVLRRSIL